MKIVNYLLMLCMICVVFATLSFAGNNTATTQSDAKAMNTTLIEGDEASELKDARGFAIPGDVTFPGTPGYFGEATLSHTSVPVTKIIMFQQYWDITQTRNMLKKKTSKDVQVRALVAKAKVPTKELFVSIEKPASSNIQTMAFATVAAESKACISPGVFAEMVTEASAYGANYVMFLAEGTNRTVESWGVGIGFSHTNADLKGGGNGSSGVSTGGTGWSYGQAGYVDKPWLQAVFLKIPKMDLPAR